MFKVCNAPCPNGMNECVEDGKCMRDHVKEVESGKVITENIRCKTLPKDAQEKKTYPIASGVLDYFPDAIVAVSKVSFIGNEQHHKGEPLHWDRSKSTDEADAMMRHFMERGTLDSDGLRHSAKLVWRSLALLQKEIEGEVAQICAEGPNDQG